jgi:hypothetical protein
VGHKTPVEKLRMHTKCYSEKVKRIAWISFLHFLKDLLYGIIHVPCFCKTLALTKQNTLVTIYLFAVATS